MYTAYFDLLGDYTVSVSVNNEAWGSVSGGGVYPYGSEVTLTAEAASGCIFDGWTDGEWNPVRTITVKRDTQFTALFSVDSTLINGIGEAERLAFTVRPNPTAGLLTVERAGGEPCVAEVYDDKGHRVLCKELSGEVSTLDVSRLASGHYVLKLNDGKASGVRGFVKK